MTKRGNGGGHNNHAFGSDAKEGWSGGKDERGAESLEKWRGGTVNGSYINFNFKGFLLFCYFYFCARAHAGSQGYAEPFAVFE